MNFLVKKVVGPFASVAITLIGLLVLGCGPSSRRGYRIEKGEVVIYTGWPASRSIIGEADADSFTAINDEYGKDKTHVFYIGKIIPNADPATFEYLSGAYSRDKNNGYSRDKLISTDGPHVKVVPNINDTPTNVTAEGAPYVRDRYRVYKDTFIIEGADPASFVFVPMFNGNYLTHDNRRVYFQDRPIEGADGVHSEKCRTLISAINTVPGAWYWVRIVTGARLRMLTSTISLVPDNTMLKTNNGSISATTL
ncbi:hypothetical protein GO730_19800 [Spirosoma sp. HMF3257]|uniref:Uncharacterized protein n=1 Tax=Spirosoma telluris TaxID=2183553 RepID=A0A327NKD6_9BACT|nr:hypothetical protein [Spirosoma telluris]RAI75831.1 hypothetical protein HMF3257_19725 [Spirosoma telluris]